MPLTKPFDYATILIGDEVIYRGMNQQQAYAAVNAYGMKWDTRDDVIRSSVRLQGQTMKTNDFNVPASVRHCPVAPPCPWPKTSDDLDARMIMPMMFNNVKGVTYNIKVAQQTGSASTAYKIGNTISDYTAEQSKLDPSVRNDFLYYEPAPFAGNLGKAIFVVEKIQGGSVTDTFTYLFLLV